MMVGLSILLVQLDTLQKFLLDSRPVLVPHSQPTTLRDEPFTAFYDLVGYLDNQGRDLLRAVVERGHILDHLDNIQQSCDVNFHIGGILNSNQMVLLQIQGSLIKNDIKIVTTLLFYHVRCEMMSLSQINSEDVIRHYSAYSA